MTMPLGGVEEFALLRTSGSSTPVGKLPSIQRSDPSTWRWSLARHVSGFMHAAAPVTAGQQDWIMEM